MARRRLACARPLPAVVSRRHREGALMVVDNEPLHAAAWSELRQARRRLTNASRDLHRHEQVDEPGFRKWLGETFPVLVTAVRDLSQQIAAKSRLVQMVQDESWMSGRSARAVWRTWQREAARPPVANEVGRKPLAGDDEPSCDDDDGRDIFESLFEEFDTMRTGHPAEPTMRTPPAAHEARNTYRRLVQHLHPDRGGAWTPERARLWHDVQAAWEARDADMLARLEAEWDIVADTLGPTSAVGRLRAALAEVHAARRDAERRIRHYRTMPDWRFSLKPPDARRREEFGRSLEVQRKILGDELARLEAIIAGWERTATRRHARRGAYPVAAVRAT